MSLPARLAVIHPTVPVISVELTGKTIPGIPNEIAVSDISGDCPYWGGYYNVERLMTDANRRNHFTYSDYPTLFASAYSSDGLKTDYVGIKLYSFSSGDPLFTSSSGNALVQPENLTPFGDEIAYHISLIAPSLASTLSNPEALMFIAKDDGSRTSGKFPWAGWKIKADGSQTLVGLWDSVPDDGGYSGSVIYAAIPNGDSYYVLRNSGGAQSFVLTVCSEDTFPSTGGSHYAPGFDDPDLPSYTNSLYDFFNFGNYQAEGSYVCLSITSTDAGFLISFRKKISGVWYPKYILVSYDWTTFQWVEFTAANSIATDIISQSAGDPFVDSTYLHPTKAVSAFTKNGIWYLAGGSRAAPVVALSEPDDLSVITIGATPDVGVGYFYDSPFGNPTAVGVIDGAFFGYVDMPFPVSLDLPDSCADLVVVANPLGGGSGSGGECLIRSWTFTLDGHDFFCIRLGCLETIVYDTYAEEWYSYTTAELDTWRLLTGMNWIGAEGLESDYGSSVLVGDEKLGVLYFLDPTKADDDNPLDPEGDTVPFERIVQGMINHSGRSFSPCSGVQLIGSMGDVQDASLTNVTLLMSDNAGHTYVNCGTRVVTPDSYNFRIEWNSLGSIRMPGRLFKIKDFGSLIRIDGLFRLNAPDGS